MNAPTAIHVDHVWKRFRVVTSSSSYGRLSEVFTNLGRRLRGGRDERETFWALKDVDFEVPQGQAVGLIGHNGAGKSTLLKVVSRITRPSKGRVGVTGRVGSLLEVGTGFHPELTGRENIFVNGAILGMSRREVRTKLEEIVAFAEVGRFLDTPVKRYSSGMKVRLAFAVAAHLEPEVMLVDEVLAVGDAAFQKKCLGKMGEVAGGGRTVLFVSHNMLAVRGLCERAIWLDGGEVRADGPAGEVADDYAASLEALDGRKAWEADDAPGGEWMRLREIAFDPIPDDRADPVRVRVLLDSLRDCEGVRPGVRILTADRVPVCLLLPPATRDLTAGESVEATVELPGGLLAEGRYTAGAVLLRNETAVEAAAEGVVTFELTDRSPRGAAMSRQDGVIAPVCEWTGW